MYVFVYGFVHLYAYCYVGKNSTDCYLAFGDYLYESNWMALPSELQKIFTFMIAHAQIPIFYHGFYVVILDLELFTRVNTIHFTSFAITIV